MTKKLLVSLLFSILMLGAVPTVHAQTLTVKGSDTMVPVVARWAEEFMNTEPKVDVAVTGGGSGTGIAALINGTTDICSASREMKAEEKQQAEAKGRRPHEIPVAFDGLTVIVNPANTVNELSMDQLKDIFTGKMSSWSALGGSDTPVVLLSRENSSGTFVFFQEHVLAKQDFGARARFVPSSAAIVQAVAADKGAVGYVGMAYAEKAAGEVKSLPVKKDASAPAVNATVENVKNKSYPIARPLYFYTGQEPKGSAKGFIDYVLSPAGQKVALDEGYVPIN